MDGESASLFFPPPGLHHPNREYTMPTWATQRWFTPIDYHSAHGVR